MNKNIAKCAHKNQVNTWFSFYIPTLALKESNFTYWPLKYRIFFARVFS